MEPLLILVAAFLISFGGARALASLPLLRNQPKWQIYVLSGLILTLAIILPTWLLLGTSLAGNFVLILTLAFAVGVLADAFKLPRLMQVLIAIGIAFLATQLGFLILEAKPPFMASYIQLGSWAIPITCIWILAITFAVMLCRRLPGLTSGLVGVVSLAFLIISLVVSASRSLLIAPLACAIAGAAWGAFPFDLPPRRPSTAPLLNCSTVYLPQGAAGHWVLGFALALLSVVGFLKNTAFLLLAAPLLLLWVPFIEATYAFVYGGREKRFSFSLTRRRELLHEALQRGGLSPRRCVAVFLAITVYFSAIALLLAVLVQVTFLVKLLVLGVFGGFGIIIFYCAARILSRRLIAQAAASEKIDFLEVPVTTVDMDGALAKIEQYVQTRTPHMIATTDSSAIVRAHKDEELAAILKAADLVTPDGAGVVWMAKVLGLPIEQRVSGVDLVDKICARAARQNWSIYLLGAAPGVSDAAAEILQQRHPGLRVAGCMHGYYTAQEEPCIIDAIIAARPDILFVGFGIPKQEKWIARYMQQLNIPVAIGVGGSFDVISGRLQRAPKWMQSAGLEWLYRTLQQPKRLPRLIVLPRLLIMTLREVYQRRRK